ncbi:FAD-dependent oxidoreductase [Pseudonocardia eucalypti]|uniref:ferredoxin--NADP(+) reductase n=1 Tax=Pseudonocardia eucalypti TaxID=648755 RepID=A0ABP9QXD1_9PSEU|nr:ferredoxin--NADP+ reductase [Pseudonocardia eucalypti]
MSSLRIAVVGSGPAGMYAVGHLLGQGPEVVESVTVLDRLPTPFGLVRAGVAPDHQKTKKVAVGFGRLLNDPRVRCYFNVEVGAGIRHNVTHEEVLDHHHAVVYAVGASGSRSLGMPGEDLPGSAAATEFVAWYNGHPDFSRMSFDLSSPRVVIVGSGNVAVDIARVLTMPIDTLRATDIADHALHVLERSAVREVVLLARRGPESAAFSSPELLALTQLRDIDIIVDADLDKVPTPQHYGDRLKLALLREVAARPSREGRRRIVFRFLSSPAEIVGDTRVRGIRVRRNALRRGRPVPTDRIDHFDTSLVLRSIGYRGRPIAGLPFDGDSGVIPNHAGRVEPGVYVTGWIKRGPTGVIGTNKHDSAETIESLLDDARSGRLSEPTGHFAGLVARRGVEAIGLQGWATIDAHERGLGASALRPRVKITSTDRLLEVARGTPSLDPAANRVVD